MANVVVSDLKHLDLWPQSFNEESYQAFLEADHLVGTAEDFNQLLRTLGDMRANREDLNRRFDNYIVNSERIWHRSVVKLLAHMDLAQAYKAYDLCSLNTKDVLRPFIVEEAQRRIYPQRISYANARNLEDDWAALESKKVGHKKMLIS